MWDLYFIHMEGDTDRIYESSESVGYSFLETLHVNALIGVAKAMFNWDMFAF